MAQDVSVVIPSIKDDIITLDSVPEGVPVSVEREGSLNEARNRGVRNADTEIVAIMDDDIAFSENLFESVVDLVDEETFVGVSDWEFGLIAGRVMIFYRSIWEDVGGFDERLQSHNGDTDFSLKVHEAGYELCCIPRALFHHEEHDRSVTTWDRAWRLAYLCGKHPRYSPFLISSIVAYNLGLRADLINEPVVPNRG